MSENKQWYVRFKIDHQDDPYRHPFLHVVIAEETDNFYEVPAAAVWRTSPSGHRKQERTWPFDAPDSLDEAKEEMTKEKFEGFYVCGPFYSGDHKYEFEFREATEADIAHVNTLLDLQEKTEAWSDKTNKWTKEVTEKYGSTYHHHILAHAFAVYKAEQMIIQPGIRDKLADRLYKGENNTHDLSEDELCELLLKENSDPKFWIARLDAFFRERYPKAAKGRKKTK